MLEERGVSSPDPTKAPQTEQCSAPRVPPCTDPAGAAPSELTAAEGDTWPCLLQLCPSRFCHHLQGAELVNASQVVPRSICFRTRGATPEAMQPDPVFATVPCAFIN